MVARPEASSGSFRDRRRRHWALESSRRRASWSVCGRGGCPALEGRASMTRCRSATREGWPSCRKAGRSPRAGASPTRGCERRASPASGGATASRSRLRPACGSPQVRIGSTRKSARGLVDSCRGSLRRSHDARHDRARATRLGRFFFREESSASARGEGERKASRADRSRSEPFTRRSESLLGRSRHRGRVLVTHARSASAPQGTPEGRRITSARSKCRRIVGRNTEASAGVNPAFPNRVGIEAIRSGPRLEHTSLTKYLVGCRRRS